MRVIRIENLDDDRLADYTRLTDVQLRRVLEPERGIYMAESTKVITRALAAGHKPCSLLTTERWLDELSPLLEMHDVPVFVGEQDIVDRVAGFHLHRGALAAMQRPVHLTIPELLRNSRRIAVLEGLVDHTNVGAIFRSAAALGVDGVVLSPDCADPLYRRAVRVSMGASLTLPYARATEWPEPLEVLRSAGFELVAFALAHDAIELDAYEPGGRVAIMLGSEGHGLREESVKRADRIVRIPMAAGVDSLNVAAASAVAFWAVRSPRPESI
jgi:tRNA G18 (ribose-2'-O)-methylase SpoU